MSGSLNSIYNTFNFALSRHMAAMARLQEQVSTGSQVNRASDDPTGSYQMLGLASQAALLDNFIENASTAADYLQISDTVISSMKQQLTDAINAISQVTSGTYGDQARERTAEQIDQIIEQIVQLANAKHNGLYLFAGGSSGTAPYAVERTDGKIISISYQGSQQVRSAEVAPGIMLEVFSAGDKIFRSDERGEPQFSGLTGAKAGEGTSNVCGDVWLTVINDGSNYKISIDDGLTYTTVPAGGSTNQAVTDSRTGKVLYVDTTGINATGVELVRVGGTYDLFNTLIAIRNGLRSSGGLSIEQLAQFRSSAMSSIDEVSNVLLQSTVRNGSKMNFLETIKNGLTDARYASEEGISQIEDADIAQVAIELSRREVLYQMSLSAAARMMSLSLLDYITE